MKKPIELMNYVNGEYISSDITKPLTSYKGEIVGKIYGTTPSLTRKAKRSLPSVKDLENFSIESIRKLLTTTMQYYFTQKSELETVALLSGTPVSFVSQGIEEFKHWTLKIDEYVEMAFGDADYSEVSVEKNGVKIAIRSHVSKGPLVAILPQNDAGESIYILANAILSRSPTIVKPSSNAAAAYPTLRFIYALNKAVDALGEVYSIWRNSIAVLNIVEDDDTIKLEKTIDLFVDHAQFIVFGSDAVVKKLVDAIEKKHTLSHVIKLGTGFSISLVLDDCDISHTVSEIVTSATEDKGNQCHTTSVAYVEEPVYEEFVKRAKKLFSVFEAGDPLHPATKIGILQPDTCNKIITKLNHMYGTKFAPRYSSNSLSFGIIEAEAHEHAEEIPAPVLIVKKIQNKDDFFVRAKEDLTRNTMKKNLITSVYTREVQTVLDIAKNFPSHMFKHNKGSGKLDFTLEHQGIYLIQELLDKRVVELE